MRAETVSEVIAAHTTNLTPTNLTPYNRRIQRETGSQCRLCQQFYETVGHIVSACSVLAKEQRVRIYYLFIAVKHNTEVNYPYYRMSLLHICFRQHVSTVKRPSSGLYRASHVKYSGFGTQWDPIVFTIILQ
jgi:hypothetical protein